jgi:toxin ParE1/3/4
VSPVTLLPLADDDLLALWLHIATDNPIAADAYLDRIHHVCSLIAENPAMGVDRDEFRDGVRSFVVEGHVVFYVAKDEGITVLRVWPSARDPVTLVL